MVIGTRGSKDDNIGRGTFNIVGGPIALSGYLTKIKVAESAAGKKINTKNKYEKHKCLKEEISVWIIFDSIQQFYHRLRIGSK